VLGFLRRKRASSPALAAPVPTPREGTTIYVMPEKFLRPEAPPFWTAGKVWTIVVVLVAGLVGAVYWLLSSATPPPPAPAVPVAPSAPAVSPGSAPETSPPQAPPAPPSPEVTPPPPAPTPDAVSSPPAPATPLPSSLDADQDGLTDVEEALYGTEAGKPDSDADGFADREELLNGYNPAGPGRLSGTGLFKTYTVVSPSAPGGESAASYTVNYPSGWAADERGQEQEVHLIASPEEFVSVSVQPNPDELALVEWYRQVVAAADPSSLNLETAGEHSGLFSPDRQTFYFMTADRPAAVFVASYHSGDKAELNFRTTFAAIIQSVAWPSAAP
jgi:hypothetical protein